VVGGGGGEGCQCVGRVPTCLAFVIDGLRVD
jgi:hypothetical protein